MAAFTALLGAKLNGMEGEVETAASLEGKAAVGLYFAKKGVEACKEFTLKLMTAYAEALKGKGLEVVLVSLDATEEDYDGLFEEMPWLALPFGSTAEKEALQVKFEVGDTPLLVILNPEGESNTTEGVAKVTEDPGGEEFPWEDRSLPEDTILERMGPMPPEAGEDGLKGFFLNLKNYPKLGLTDSADKDDSLIFSGMNPRPYVEVPKAQILEEVKKMGFASDFHPYQKDIEKFTGDNILMILDPEKAYGEKFVACIKLSAYEREKKRLDDRRQEIIDEHMASFAKDGGGGEDGGGDGEEPEENIVVRDLPKIPQPWVSEFMDATHHEVINFTIQNSRPLMQVMISRPRSQFGKASKFSDSGENLQNCRPQKDPNFALQRRELEVGVQSVKDTKSASCQTTWFRPVNKSTQYSPSDFLQGEAGLGYEQVDALSEFLSAVSVSVEEALQTNETVDIFQDEFKQLGSDETNTISEASSNIREQRNFHDVTYTRNKRIEWIEWIPESLDMLACSYCDNLTFIERLDQAGKAGQSTILVWSFQDALSPHAVILAPWEVPVFKFYPSDKHFIIGGLSCGQLICWKLSDADLGLVQREKPTGIMEEEKTSSALPTITFKQLSVIDESHKKPVLQIEWLPPAIEIERRGRGASEKNPKDGPIKYFLTIAGDGQVILWDFSQLMDGLNDHDFFWRPVHKIQMQRQDSGTEMGLCQLLYCHDRYDEKENKQLTNFYASTEEGELIFGDWAARVEEDRKPEFCKKMFTISKTFRPMLSLERSPFFPDILLGVTDWAFYLWKDNVSQHLFQSSYSSTYFTQGLWSPTRPSVIFLGLQSGGIDIWDFNDQSHKASLSDTGASVAISSMVFLRQGDIQSEQKLAVGDVQGHLHVHSMPKNLVRQVGKEFNTMQKFLEREEQRVKYFESRRTELADLKEKLEKQEQMAAGEEDADKGKANTADDDRLDQAAEAVYQKLEEDCIEQLKTGGAGS